MSFETQLKATYAQAHRRLINPLPPQPKIKKVPPPPRAAEVQVVLENPVIPDLPTEKIDPPLPQYSLARLCEWVAGLEGVTSDELKSRQRNQYIARARIIFYHLAYKHSRGRFSSMQVARFIRKDHTSVLSGIKRMAHLRQNDRGLDYRLKQYEETLIHQNIVVEGPPDKCLCIICPYRESYHRLSPRKQY